MGIIKEPLNVDFVVENRSLTKEEEIKISEFIISQKRKNEIKEKTTRRATKTIQKI